MRRIATRKVGVRTCSTRGVPITSARQGLKDFLRNDAHRLVCDFGVGADGECGRDPVSLSEESEWKLLTIQALRSHPDRATLQEKEQATAQFKMIAEAYEVLGDDRRRWEYDRFEYPLLHGGISDDAYDTYASTSPGGHSFVWESSFDSARRAQQGRYGPDGAHRGHGFDPFELFNSMFARDFHEMESESSLGNSSQTFMDDPFASMRSSFGGGMGHSHGAFGSSSTSGMSPFSLLNGFSPTHTSGPRGMSSFATSSSNMSMFSGPNGAGGESETRRTTVVNGNRETVITKRDAQGNETIRKITPQGEKIYVNGQLQPTLEAPKPQLIDTQTNSTQTEISPSTPDSDVSTPRAEPTSTARRKKWKLF